jgi:hypothetical protein
MLLHRESAELLHKKGSRDKKNNEAPVLLAKNAPPVHAITVSGGIQTEKYLRPRITTPSPPPPPIKGTFN